jgi:hypothetical protein
VGVANEDDGAGMIDCLDDCFCLCMVTDELRYDVLDRMPPGPQADRLRRLVEQIEDVADFIVDESDRRFYGEDAAS